MKKLEYVLSVEDVTNMKDTPNGGCGTVEQHYFCPRCTYLVEQVYSPVYVGISTDCPEEYLGIVEGLGLDFYKLEEMP